jgi:hypothetical protein
MKSYEGLNVHKIDISRDSFNPKLRRNKEDK